MTESYFQAKTQESLRKVCRCWETSAEMKIRLIIIVHVPRGLSCYIWCAIQEGAKFKAEEHTM